MFRHAGCASTRRVNRGASNSVSPTLLRCRNYSLPRAPLPAPPEPSTAPLPKSELSKYLEPLCQHGWAVRRFDYHGTLVLRRHFGFFSPADLKAFAEKTRDISEADIRVYRVVMGFDVQLRSPDGSITRNLLRAALEYQTQYQNLSTPDYPPVLDANQNDETRPPVATPRTTPPPPPPTPIVAVPLPLPPPAPAISAPSIDEHDLPTYLQPLAANGWKVAGPRPISVDRRPLARVPSLNRAYYFHDFTSARHFLNVMLTTMPPPTPGSLAGVQMWLAAAKNMVQVWSFSEFPKGSRPRYGISHADVRFAIELEGEYASASWVGRANNVHIGKLQCITSMEDVWNYRDSRVAAVE
ncbi:hypothetical protein DFH09DRAFT_53051 [Mycena vulgaris]|nr:hypothetical protein DFH09DRAFT_53051 [Mycena vulgaris]